MKKILILTTVGPDKKGYGSYQDIYNRISLLDTLNLEVRIVLFSQNDIDRNHVAKNWTTINRKDDRWLKFDGAIGLDTPVQVARMMETVDDFKPDIILAEYFNFSVLLKRLKQKYPGILYFFRSHNYELQHLREKFALKKPESMRELLFRYYNLVQCKRYENAMMAVADKVLCISKYDARLYSRRFKKNMNIHFLPAGIEFKPVYRVKQQACLNAIYIGSDFTNSFNLEGAHQITEIARQTDSAKMKFHITGRFLPESLLIDSKVKYHGFVPDLEELLKEMDFAILPNRYGFGIKIKAYELLRRGFPTIITGRIHKSLDGRDGETYLVANNISHWISQSLRMKDDDLRSQLSKNALGFMQQNFSRDRIIRQIKNHFGI